MSAAGDGPDAAYPGGDDYGQVYDDADVNEHPQVDEEAMQEQPEAAEDYADDEDLYNDIVPGLGQVDGVSLVLCCNPPARLSTTMFSQTLSPLCQDCRFAIWPLACRSGMIVMRTGSLVTGESPASALPPQSAQEGPPSPF